MLPQTDTNLEGGGGASVSNSTPQTPSAARAAATVPASRVDRLLRERIRKSRSAQALDHLDEWDKWEQDLVPIDRVEPSGGRLIVVANRLPVTCSKDAAGKWKLQISAGGLVSALMGVNNYSTLWIGWPGIYVKPGKDREALAAMLQREGYLPVWLESGLLDLYYNGFCNSVLWQLFHYVPLQLDGWQRVTEHQTLQMQWGAYQQANERFGEVVLGAYQPGDMVWVQDYHLMLLPSMLKNAVPRMKVGWFLHTPFPSSEIYRTLPVREEVLRATLRSDLIGFHTYDYARHFISSCTRILGLEGTPEGVEDNGSVARVAAFPIGIDPERFAQALETEEVQVNIAKLLNRYAGRKVMLGVDRLDMIKGIPQKLLAFEKFLHEHPEWRDKVLLVQIAVPSRTDVPEYQKLRSMVHEIVGRINGAFGTLTYVPIHHLDRQLSFHELCALYAVTDVALITSLRDGMNLVSYEYVACQADNAGVLVLSEFAGAAQSLGAGSILVNPWNINDVAAAIEDALTMSEEERRERHRQNYMHVATHTAQTWADTFISELNDTHIEADLRLRHTPPELDVMEVVRGYHDSSRRLIVLGYNATLTTAVEAPRQPKRHFDQIKALTRVNPRIMKCLEELSADPANEVLVFSGSEMSKLEETFGNLPVWLAAENGVYLHPPKGTDLPQEWKCLFDTLPKEWMESVQLVLDYFCERTPRSFVEGRDTSLVWNYKHADVEFGRLQARDLLQHLWTGPISNAPVEIIQGGRSVEVRPVCVTKGVAMQRCLGYMAQIMGRQAVHFDFVLCIGHLLLRDENMYLLFEGHLAEGVSRADTRAAIQTAAAAAAAAAAAQTAAAAQYNSSGSGAGNNSGSSSSSIATAAVAAVAATAAATAVGPAAAMLAYHPVTGTGTTNTAGTIKGLSPPAGESPASQSPSDSPRANADGSFVRSSYSFVGGEHGIECSNSADGSDSDHQQQQLSGQQQQLKLLQEQFPLLPIAEQDEAARQASLDSAAAAAADARHNTGRTLSATSSNGVSIDTTSSHSSTQGQQQQTSNLQATAGKKQQQQAGNDSRAAGSTNVAYADGVADSAANNGTSSTASSNGISSDSSKAEAVAAAAQERAYLQEAAASASAGVYAAAKTRRNQRQQQVQQQQKQAAQAASAAAAQDGSSSQAVQQSAVQQQQQQEQPLAQPPPYPRQQQQQQQQQQQDRECALRRALSSPLQMLLNQQQQVQQQQQQLQQQQQVTQDAAAGGPPSPARRHKRSSSGGNSSTANGLNSSAAGGSNSGALNMRGVLKFPPKYLFTCSVGRSRSKARYSLTGSNDVGTLLESIIKREVQKQNADGFIDQGLLSLHQHQQQGSIPAGLGSARGSLGGGFSSGSSSIGGADPGAVASSSSTGSHEAILRAIEAASAARGHRHSRHNHRSHHNQHLMSPKTSAEHGDIVHQGSLQGFARVGTLIGSDSGSRPSANGETADAAALSWHAKPALQEDGH